MSVIDVEKKEIKRISDTSLKTMRNSSAYGLPNTPANSGMKAAQVKPKFYDFALSQNGVSLFTEINRIVAEINIVLAAYGINFETINTNFGDTNESITTHKNNVSNPHSVSAAQVGAYTKEEITNILNGKVKTLQDQLTTLDKTVSEMAGVDTGFSETITAMKNKLDNFFGETSDATDVIDTLNEIRNELASLDSASKKALYNLGAYDTISGNVITRRTGYINKDNITSYGINGPYPYPTFFIRGDFLSNIAHLGIKSNKSITLYSLESDNVSVSYTSYFNSSEELDQFIRELEIQYETKSYYTEEIIENQPLITLDSQGSKWLTDEWEKGLQLFDKNNAKYGTGWDYDSQASDWVKVYDIPVKPNTTYSINVSANVSLHNGSDYTTSNTSTFTTNSDTIKIAICVYVGSGASEEVARTTFANLTLVKGSKAYSHHDYNANKHITNFEAEFLKEVSLKSANKFNGFSAKNVDYYYQELTPNTNYTLSIGVKDSSYSTNVSFGITNDVNSPTDFVWVINEGNLIHTDLTFNSSRFKYLFAYPSSNANTHSELKSKFNIMLVEGTEVQPYHEFEGEIVRSKELEEFKSLFDIKEITPYYYYYESKEYYCFEASLGVYRVHLYDSTAGIDETITIIYDGNKNNFNYPVLYFDSYHVSINISYQKDDEENHYTPLFHFDLLNEDNGRHSYDIAKKCTKIL